MPDNTFTTKRTKLVGFAFWDARQAQKEGKKLTLNDKIIMMRSDETHEETIFPDRDSMSFSSTQRDDADGCRFKKIIYGKYAKRWRIVWMPVTPLEEARMWARACKDADMPIDWQYQDYSQWEVQTADTVIFQGEKHLRYDGPGLLSFALEDADKWWLTVLRKGVWCWTAVFKPSPTKVWCSEECSLVWNDHDPTAKEDVIKPTEISPHRSMLEKERIKKLREAA